jgi:hypothetical protein
MVAPLLVADINGTDTDYIHQVYIMTGTDVDPLGDTIDESGIGLVHGNSRYVNSVINAFGGVYCLGGSGVWKLQGGSQFGVWSKDSLDGGYTFPTVGGSNANVAGPFYTVIDSEPYIFGTQHTGNTTSRVWRINLLTGVGERGLDQTNPGLSNSIMFNGQAFTNGPGVAVVTINPAGLTMGIVAFPSSGVNSLINGEVGDYNIFNGKLYFFAQNRPSGSGFNGKPILYEWGAGQFTAIVTDFESVDRPYAQTDGRWCLFDDGTNMYAIYYNNEASNEGWKMFQLDFSGGTFSLGIELTNAILPTGLRPGNGSSSTGAWFVYKDQDNTGSADIFLGYAANNAGGQITLYQFINNSTELSFVQSGADGRYAVPNWESGGGDRELDLAAPQITVYKRVRDSGGEKVTFRVFPPLQPLNDYDGTNLTVNFFFGVDGDIPLTQALLTGTATGGSAVRTGNSITGVESDGITDYTAVIQAFGFNDLDNINLTAEVSGL